ncbi:MAG: hypothetical protein HQL96_02665 [Magnetococcales bacterium]|nr:hypothetical protein [Magnetococcales bacterium]
MTLETLFITLNGIRPPEGRPLLTPQRLARLGRGGRIAPGSDAVALAWRLLDPAGRGRRSIGYLAALGMDLHPDPERTWACLSFAHLRQTRERLVFIDHETTRPRPDERELLTDSLASVLDEAGWSLHPTPDPQLWLLSTGRHLEVEIPPLAHLDGASLLDRQPTGADAMAIVTLVTHGQMALARHEVNGKRQRAGLPPLNTPWIWGVGRGVMEPPHTRQTGTCWSREAAICGLARASGWSGHRLDGSSWERVIETVLAGRARIGLLDCAGVTAREWNGLDAGLLAPLAAAMGRRGGRLLIAGGGEKDEGVPWHGSRGWRLRIGNWLPPHHLAGGGPVSTIEELRESWLA